MEKTLGKEYENKVERIAFLKDNCDACENKGYMKPYTPAELQGHKEKLANVSIEISEIEAEMKQAQAEYKGRLKPLKEARSMMVSNIKSKAEYVTEVCYRFTDQETNIHRTFFGRDLAYMCEGLKYVYFISNTLEIFFANSDSTIWNGFERLRETFAQVNGGKYSKHISNPIGNAHKGGSACKRLNLMLRWLCRQDGIVDLGIWHNVKPNQLMIPLDTHVARIGRELGLIKRKSDDRITVEELTDKLRDFDENDPCKYDFALFGYGESQKRVKP